MSRTARVEVTPVHVDRVELVARALARTKIGSLAGVEELLSEAQVVLWQLALAWDPDQGVPFNAYLSMHTRHRLIDYLRRTYGRVEQQDRISPKMAGWLNSVSLDELVELEIDGDPRRSDFSVEDEVIAREQWQAFWVAVAQLSEFERRVLLWPILEDSAQACIVETGKTKHEVAAKRFHTKVKVAELIDRPVSKRIYHRGNGAD